MAIDYEIYLGDQTVVDGMGSVIVNLNSTGSPAYTWITQESLAAYGPPTTLLSAGLPFKDTVSYKIKYMDSIYEHDSLTNLWGDAACLTNPATCNGRGPFYVLGKPYYVDYLFMYIVNTGDEDVYCPVYSVDSSKCDADFGYFIGSPSVPANTVVGTSTFFTSAPKYTNDLSVLSDSYLFKFTTLDSSFFNIETTLTVPNILNLVSNTISNGQEPVIGEDVSSSVGVTLTPGDYHPFVLFRYISSVAPTKPINIDFRFGIHQN